MSYVPPPVGGTRVKSRSPAVPVNLHGAKVLVTGGAGFVGSNLIQRLTTEFKAKVHVIDNLWRGTLENLEGRGIDVSKDVTIADLTSQDECMKHIRDADVVFHLADIVAGVDFVFSNQNFVFRQNLLINTNVLAACAANGIKNYIYVGTACSFPQHLQMDENYKTVALHEDVTYPAEPESSYGWSKLMGETWSCVSLFRSSVSKVPLPAPLLLHKANTRRPLHRRMVT
jgi:nucleoside-diphosphate-sugar epimerase